MNINKKYIEGFTFVELVMSMIMTLAATVLLLFVYKESSIKHEKNMLEKEILSYANLSLDYIQGILTDATASVERSAPYAGFSSYTIEFNSVKTKNRENEPLNRGDKAYCERTLEGIWIEAPDFRSAYFSCIVESEIRITMDPLKGFTFKTGNQDVTPPLLKLASNSFEPSGRDFIPGYASENQNNSELIKPYTQYIIKDWGIDRIESGDLYHRISSSKQSALSESSHIIWLEIEIQNMRGENFDITELDSDLIQIKRFERTAFSPYAYVVRKTSSNKPI